MRIKKLELVGFKSFKDRTVIHFDAGITGIVGPNGCGKSNIVDALVWVMGEQSAKHLRGASMEDVIFGGAEGYAPAGLAEVSLVLENDGGPFPVKYSKFTEIQITRRLHRSGESEYLINKEIARLRDIQEIFMDTGAGSKGFSIIEQGAIGKIITAKPEERRTLIEEAAGITKFKVRKRESQRKLQATDQNLIRLSDIVGELKRQLDSLQRQAKRAERYREIKQRVEELDLWLSSQKYLDLKHIKDAAQNKFQDSETLEVGGKAELEKFEIEQSTLHVAVLEKEQSVQQLQSQYFELQTHTQRKEMEIQTLRFEVESAQKQAEVRGHLRQDVEARQNVISKEYQDVVAKLESLKTELLTLEKDSQDSQVHYQTAQKRVTEADQELTDRRREMVAVGQSETVLKEQAAAVEARIEEIIGREEKSREVLKELESKKDEFEKRKTTVYAKLEKERQMQLDIMHDVENFEQNLSQVKGQLEDKRFEMDSLKDELNKVTSRLYGLEELQTNFEGFEEGVKQVMLWQKLQQVHPDGQVSLTPVAEVVEVPAEFEAAMEAALGSKLQLLLSENPDKTLAAVDYLKETKRGRSSFYVSGSSEGPSSQAPQGAGVVAILKDLVRAPERHQPTVSHLLSHVVVVDNIRTALSLRSEHPGWTFVTTEGDSLSADGVLTGGASETADSGMLKRRREIKELSLIKDEVAGKLGLVQASLKKLEESYNSVEKDLDNAHQVRSEKEVLMAELKKDFERAETELHNLLTALQRQNNEVSQVEAQRLSQEDRLQETRTHLSDRQSKRVQLEQIIQALEQELHQVETGIEGLREKATQMQVSVASRRQEVEGLSRQEQMLSNHLREIDDQLSKMQDETQKTHQVISLSQVQLEEAKIALEKMIIETEMAQKNLSLKRNEYEELSAQLREVEERISALRREQSQLQLSMNEARLQLDQAQLKEGYLVDQIRERYMLDLTQVCERFKDQAADAATMELELEDLRDKLKKIGEVNLSAIEEYDDVVKRYEFLSQQQTDLVEAKEQLRRVIDRINRICSRRFRETFAAVNERFQKVFPVLFGGGEAQLVLIENEEGDDGIDIVARPPGKKLQSVTLLSGGEKALSSVALIFAIFLVKPSPFCLLDEVDAPLDDANVARFNDLVKEMAKRSQIIVVTHNKHTMEINEKLYGVTMQERGVSKMVSVSLEDAQNVVA